MRIFRISSRHILVALPYLILTGPASHADSASFRNNPGRRSVIINPYEKVNWSKSAHYKAALHVHTMQSDGYHMPAEVIHAYKNKGFSILAITDHDWNRPNHHITHGRIPKEKSSPYPKNPKPYNYPANPTWPWTDYGGPEPGTIGMAGIQGNELTFRHHMNSYFSDYGVWYTRTGREAPYGGITDENGNEIFEDDQLLDIKEKGGLSIMNHPGISEEYSWWVLKLQITRMMVKSMMKDFGISCSQGLCRIA